MSKINKSWKKRSLQKIQAQVALTFLLWRRPQQWRRDRHITAARFPKSPHSDSGTGEAAECKQKAESLHRHAPGGLQCLPAGTNANRCQ